MSDYSFTNIRLDTRFYKTVFSDKNVLAVQVYYNSTVGPRIPFYMLPRLGGESRLRGIMHENFYRDRNAAYIQAEARRHLFGRFGCVVFVGAGEVSHAIPEFTFRNIKYVFGVGGRFQPFRDEKLNLRLDIGKGPADQHAVYLSVLEAF